MIEGAIFAAIVILAATFIAWPRRADRDATAGTEAEELRGEWEDLLQELREIDDDASAGRITAEARRDARRALAPRMREVSEALRALGEPVERR